MTDSSEIGRFGTLRLLKRHDPNTTVAFYPIDDEEVTFGRGRDCSIRLYYDCISELHCTLRISEERKAFLTIQGTNGVTVDGCEITPPRQAEGLNSTTVPLTNGSEIEIFRKRFRFEYPPKEIRAALLATPRNPQRRRSLRMSMIQCAQVFSPRVSSAGVHTPRRGSIKDNADWEVLRSPVKIPNHDSPPTETMLLEGNGEDAIVVEEEKDLIILEHVEDRSKASQPTTQIRPSSPSAVDSPAVPPSLPPVGPPIPATPPNRRKSGSLRKAVVLRSAQRAHLEWERQRQREEVDDEQEEQEVELAVSPERELGPFKLHADGDEDEDDDDGKDDGEDQPGASLNSGSFGILKAGLNMVRRMTIDRLSPENIPPPPDDESFSQSEEDEPENENDADENAVQSQTPIRRNLGPFMTPQVIFKPAQRVPVDVRPRASLGGESLNHHLFGGARRVPIDEAWKINDIVVPEPHKGQKDNGAKPRITEEERQAILQRRKSALQTPSDLPMPGPRIDRSEAYTPGENEHENAEMMLEKMKEKMYSLRRKSEARRARSSFATPHKQQGFSLLAPASTRTERAVLPPRTSEEAEDQQPATDKYDELPVTPTRANGVPVSHTPRFDAVRGKFTRPLLQPKTPSFTGFRKLFDEGSGPSQPPKTPSFAGMKQLFKQRLDSVMATPRMNLDEIFEQDDYDYLDEGEDDPLQLTVECATTTSSGDAAAVEANLTEALEDPTHAYRPRKVRSTANKAIEKDVADNGSEDVDHATKTRGSKRAKTAKASKEAVVKEEDDENIPVKTRNRGAKKQTVEQILDDPSEQAQHVEPAPKGRRGRQAKARSQSASEDPQAKRPKNEQTDDTEVLAEAPKTRQRRGANLKATDVQDPSSELDEVPVSKKPRGRKVAAKKLPLVATPEEGDKENTGDETAPPAVVGKAVGKTTTRARKAMMTEEATEASGAVPTRRTRSRK